MIQIMDFKEWLEHTGNYEAYKNSIPFWNNCIIDGTNKQKENQKLSKILKSIERGYLDYINKKIPAEIIYQSIEFNSFKYHHGILWGQKCTPKSLIEL